MTFDVDTPQHQVSVLIGGREVVGWTSYDISVSMVTPPGTFSMRRPFDEKAWEVLGLDLEVRVLIDGTPVLTGFIESSDADEDDDSISIGGRCRYARLEESAPGIDFSGLGVRELVAKVAAPWFKTVTLSNARNRKVVRGKGKKAKAANEPIRINTKTGTRVEPGQTRQAVIERLLEQTGYLAWSSGDGKELVIGQPHYDQEPQHGFFRPAPGSSRFHEGTVLGMGIKRTTAERYSRVIVVGSGAGTDANYGPTAASRTGIALDGEGPDGTGGDFREPKTLIVTNTVSSLAEAEELAERELAQRNSRARVVTVRCAGHGQRVAGEYVTIFAPDVVAWVEHERTGYKGMHLIVSCSFRTDRNGGEETMLELVPRGAEIGR